jgi:hypothetical protein
MRCKSYWIWLAFCAAATLHCNNYGLRDQLENPGGSNPNSKPLGLRIFVTNATFIGNLGGIGGADFNCVADSANPMGPGNGNWKALIVDSNSIRRACLTANCVNGSSENVDWALKPNTTYFRPNGVLIGTTNSAGLFNFPLNASIADLANQTAWTGLNSDWTTSSTCTNWIDGGDANYGYVGAVDKDDLQAIYSNPNIKCNTSRHLYCVEQ